MALRPLGSVSQEDAPEVGHKAASLGDLLTAGFKVPDGVVLAAAVSDLTPHERGNLLREAAGELGAGPFAVRSSGLSEDGSDRSWAGIYETVLDVAADDLPEATERCLASARAARVADYAPIADGRLGVIVQRMVRAEAAGVALTADPITGDRRSCVVTAVRGSGERLVSGAASGDEWVVRDDSATARRRPERAIDARQARRVATEVRRIEAIRGSPQDIEWAIDVQGVLWILQARPITALPPDVSWEAPAKGAFTRHLRLGEWIPEPVTPLFESWLLTSIENGLHATLGAWTGQKAPRPYHVIVNGWYFYSVNFLSGGALLRSLPSVLRQLIREPRRVAGTIPPTVRHSWPLFEREWRQDLLPRYRAAVAHAESRVGASPIADLAPLIDDLADLAGEYFASIAALAGAAYKTEMNLARFYQRHLAGTLGGSHLTLLAGLEPPADPGRHAVASLDWWHAPLPPDRSVSPPASDRARLVAARQEAEEAALGALASSPRRLQVFRDLLAESQHLVGVREQQVRDLTIAWPAMRRAVLRLGDALASQGVISGPEDVFFLTRDEVLGSLDHDGAGVPIDVAARRSSRDEQAHLVPPALVGRMNPLLRRLWDMFPRVLGATRSDGALVWGVPASPGRASGAVRVVRGPQDFDELQVGEILVAPLTAPAWMPLLSRAAAVVTDVGSAASHASIIAREYGIPAVVGCGDATARLRTGMRVTVDGTSGNVEPA